MSGSTIGGAVGFVVGLYFGNPQAGYMIGAAIGGAVDPEVIRAPSIGDAQRQTSQAGIPVPVIYGKPQRIKCNIIDGELQARKIIVEEQQGKGGPVVESERFLLTSAFGICEGSIAGIQRIIRNGEVVYDRSTDGEWVNHYDGVDFDDIMLHATKTRAITLANSGKIRIYLGTEDQLPDPALEAIYGVGNTPYFRGLAYFVAIDDDVTQTRGAASIWEVEPVAEGVEADTGGSTTLEVAGYSQLQNAHWPLPGLEAEYDYEGTRYINGSSFETFSASTIQEIIDHFAALGFESVLRPPSVYLGYSASTSSAPGSFKVDMVAVQPDISDNDTVMLVYNDYQPSYWVDSIALGSTACPFIMLDSASWTGTQNGEICQRVPDSTDENGALHTTCTGDETGTYVRVILPLYIKATRKRITPTQNATAIGSTGYGVDNVTGELVRIQEYAVTAGTFKVLSIESKAAVDSRQQYVYYEQGPVLALGHADYNNAAYWTAAYNAAVTAGTLPAGWTYGVEYPDVIGSVYTATTPPFETLEATDITLQSVVEKLCARAQLPTNRLDASALAADIIPGYLVASGGSVADAIRPLQQPFTFDTPSYDGKIRCNKRGGAMAFTVTDDDLLEQTDEDAITSPQDIEFPRKVHFIVPDPDANYTPSPQTAERYTPDVNAKGELSIEAPIPFRADQAKQKAEIMLNVAWNRAEGAIDRLPLPEEFSQYVPGDCFSYQSKRWIITEASYADGAVYFKAQYDRASAYSSSATGVGTTTPEIPRSGLLVPTKMMILNIPLLGDTEDRMGFYVACAGMLDNWPGALIQISGDDGVSWSNGPTVTTASVMGELTTDLDYALAHSIYEDGTFDVSVDGELSSITGDQLLQEYNACALGISPKQEICQFQTATPGVDEGDYTCTILTRGRLGTTPQQHYVGTPFAMLANAVFVEVPSAWLGRTIKVRAVTQGADADDAEVQEFDFLPASAQTELQPVLFLGTRDASDNLTVSFVGRGRLGNTATPIHSSQFDGYRITFTKGSASKSYVTTTVPYVYPATQQTIDFGSATGTMRVDIAGLNRITGAGPFLTGSIA